MNNGMIRGSDVRVEFAGEENGYIELPPDAAKNLWAQIGEHQALSWISFSDFVFYCMFPPMQLLAGHWKVCPEFLHLCTCFWTSATYANSSHQPVVCSRHHACSY